MCVYHIVVTTQDKSRSISENSTWGIRRKFEQGKVVVNHKKFLGYDKDEEGNLIALIRYKSKQFIKVIEKAEPIKEFDVNLFLKIIEKIWCGRICDGISNGEDACSWFTGIGTFTIVEESARQDASARWISQQRFN